MAAVSAVCEKDDLVSCGHREKQTHVWRRPHGAVVSAP